MADLKKLEELCNEDRVEEGQRLVDIQHISIDTNLPVSERLKKYLEDIKNPYYFSCGDLAVRICFSGSGRDLSTHLKEYFLNCNR